MTPEEREKRRDAARAALRILSGRADAANPDYDDYAPLGFESVRHSYYGDLDANTIRERAEEILLDLLLPPGDDGETEAR